MTAEDSRSPAEILRGRYARGEISRDQYREALLDVLKDMCVRGEITVDEFDARAEIPRHAMSGTIRQSTVAVAVVPMERNHDNCI